MKFIYMFAFLFFLSAAAAAQNPAPVVIDDVTVMRLYDTADGPGEKAAQAVMKRLESKIDAGASSKEITVKDGEGASSIYWGKDVILTVTKEQAAKQQSEHQSLARLWMKKILEAVGEDSLKVSKKMLYIALNEADSLEVLSGSGEIAVRYDSGRMSADVSDDGVVTVSPSAVGDYKITLSRGASRTVVKIVCRERAGAILGPVEQIVTGSPVDQDFLSAIALARVTDGLEVKPGASVYIKSDPVILQPLPLGAHTTVSVPVSVEGKDYFNFEGNVQINFRNNEIQWLDSKNLFVCNRPEEVFEDGVLFRGTVSPNEAARMLYSHKNGSSERRRLSLFLTNKGVGTTKLLVRRAAAGPDKFEMHAGHSATVRYMRQYNNQVGYVLNLKSRETLVLEDFDMSSKFIVSGLCDFQVIEGSDVEITVRTSVGGRSLSGLPEIHRPFNPFKIHPHGTFPQPQLLLEREYKINSEDSCEVEVGKWPWFIDGETGEPNTGNFGVLYTLRVKLVNDASAAQDVNLIYTPLNGTAMGTMIINGKLMETPVIRVNEPCSVGTFRVDRKDSIFVELITIPEAASSYPVKFTFTRGSR